MPESAAIAGGRRHAVSEDRAGLVTAKAKKAPDLLAEIEAEAQRRAQRPLRADEVMAELDPATAAQLRTILLGPTSSTAITAVLARRGISLSDGAIKRWRTSQRK